LDEQHAPFRNQVLGCLYEYSRNVVDFVERKIPDTVETKTGEKLLRDVRGYYIRIFSKEAAGTPTSEALQDELLTQLNNLIDHRGDRISLSTQRLFQSLNLIAVVTSILWLVPFYFLHFTNDRGDELHLGIFGWLLVIFVTFLIIIILSIIDDLDKPFDGFWMVNITSWKDLITYIETEYKNSKGKGTENISQVRPEKPSEPVSFSPQTLPPVEPIPSASPSVSPVGRPNPSNVDGWNILNLLLTGIAIIMCLRLAHKNRNHKNSRG
jgi:hypothetical protein